MDKLKGIFTPKQIDVLKSNSRILVLHGAKRAGKTFILILKFLMLIKKFKNKGYKFIIGGASLAAIKTNILDDLEKLLGQPIKISKYNTFNLFGNVVLVREGANSDSWKRVRGFTAYGCLLNEGTALHQTFIQECISRCSGEGARIFIDTNPENPNHFIKKEYIDKDGQKLKDGKINIQAIHFKLEDNTFIDEEYKESIKLSTPSGMFYERDILGIWVSGEGIVYKDFSKEENVISFESFRKKQIKRRFVGLDWGYQHFGAIVVIAEDFQGNLYLEKEIAKQHQQIEFWEEKLLEIKKEYGDILIYCDTARTDYVDRLALKGFNLGLTNKSVLEGISMIAGMIKRRTFKVVDGACPRFMEEIFQYSWDSKNGNVVKVNDDVLDAIRYAIYSTFRTPKIEKIRNYNYLGV